MAKNQLYYGDNLDVLRRYIADESVDLVYLDPPFNSNANYNVLFAEKSGTKAAAQIKAFEDTWRWDESAAEAYRDVVEQGGSVAQALIGFRTVLGDSDMLAYLAMMAPRIVELRRVLKTTGSIYLHCDQTASHYLKMLMDAVFGPTGFQNEIVWQRFGSHNDSSRFGTMQGLCKLYQCQVGQWGRTLAHCPIASFSPGGLVLLIPSRYNPHRHNDDRPESSHTLR